MRKILIALILVLAFVVTGYAQESTTVTLTEEQVNAALSVTVAHIEQVNTLAVDMEDDMATISATVTDEDGETYVVSISLVIVEQIDGAGYYWEVSAASVNGLELRQKQLNEINATIQASELHFSRTTAESNVLINATIEDDSITYEIDHDVFNEFEFEIPEVPEGFDPANFDPTSFSAESLNRTGEDIPQFNPPAELPEDSQRGERDNGNPSGEFAPERPPRGN